MTTPSDQQKATSDNPSTNPILEHLLAPQILCSFNVPKGFDFIDYLSSHEVIYDTRVLTILSQSSRDPPPLVKRLITSGGPRGHIVASSYPELASNFFTSNDTSEKRTLLRQAGLTELPVSIDAAVFASNLLDKARRRLWENVKVHDEEHKKRCKL